jgi:hypothetical protein
MAIDRVHRVTRRPTPEEERLRRHLAVVDAYRRHSKSTTRKEDAAAELAMDMPSFIATLAETRRMGFLRPNE